MLLLNGHSLTPARKIPVEAMSLQLSERGSTATMTPEDMTGISINSWMKDETEPGKGIVWRVKTISQAYATNTPKVSLEHAICTLKDRIMFGEVKPSDITGKTSSTVCTAAQAIRYILDYQSDWELGDFDYTNVTHAYKFDGDTLYDALETVSGTLEDCWWSYDFSVYPFRLNIRHVPNEVASILRPSRNITTITRTIDRSGMYTRFYPIGYDDLKLPEKYIEKNTAAYGVVSKTETNTNFSTEAELRGWATEQLGRHAEPSVTIEVDALELADATGESADRMWLGRKCLIPLGEFGTTITETITQLSYSDKVHQPETVKVTLANAKADVATIIAERIKSSASSARASTKQNKEDHAWMEDTTDHVALCAEGIIGTDAQGNPNWKRLSELVVNEDGIYSQVKSVQDDVVIASTRIEQNEDAIRLEAQRRMSDDEELRGQIIVEADRVSMVVTKGSDTRKIKYYATYADFPRPGSASYRYLDMSTHNYYEWKNNSYSQITTGDKIAAGEICTSINESGEVQSVINADKIYLLGETIAGKITADYISSKIATIPVLNTRSLSATGTISCTGYVYGDNFVIGSNTGGPNNKYVNNAIAELQIVDNGNNTYTLQKKAFKDNAWVDVATFEHAASTGTTLSGSWSGSTLTVTATPQDEHYYVAITNGTPENQDGTAYTNGNDMYIPVQSYNPLQTPPTYTTRMRAYVNAGNIKSSVSINAPTWSTPASGSIGTSNTITFKTNAPTQASRGQQLTLTQDSWSGKQTTVRMRAGGTGGDTYAKYTVDGTDVYNSGHNGVAGTDIILSKTAGGGPGSETTTVPSSDITKANGAFSGYVWLKEADGTTYKNLREFSFSMPDSATWTKTSLGTANQYTLKVTVAGKTYSKTATCPGGISW